MRRFYSFLLVTLFLPGGVCSVFAQDDASVDGEVNAEGSRSQPGLVAEIESVVASYLESFRAKDVDALLEHWTPEAVYVNRATNEQTVGREALKSQYEKHFAGDAVPELALETESIELVSPNVALERGVSIVSVTDAEPLRSAYQVVYLKRDGRWLIDRVTEEELEQPPEALTQLQRLEWLVGDWIDADDQSSVEFTCRWTENRSHLYRTYRILNDGEVESSGLQMIGWDAATKTIRSWLFDSSGSFVSGTWKELDDQWIVSSVATLNDGAKGSFVSVYTPQDDGTYRWKKINQVLDGELLPSLAETTVQPR